MVLIDFIGPSNNDRGLHRTIFDDVRVMSLPVRSSPATVETICDNLLVRNSLGYMARTTDGETPYAIATTHPTN